MRLQILFELCRFRNAHPAFNGTFEVLDTINDIRDSIVVPAGGAGQPMEAEPVATPYTSAAEGAAAEALSGFEVQVRELLCMSGSGNMRRCGLFCVDLAVVTMRGPRRIDARRRRDCNSHSLLLDHDWPSA